MIWSTVLIALVAYALGYNNGITARKVFTPKVNVKAEQFTEAVFGEGVTDDNLEPDDFEKKKQEQMPERSFFA
jgi:hypothetical protein